MLDHTRTEIRPFINVEVKLGENLQLTPDTKVIVGLNQDKSLSYPNVIIHLQRGNYDMKFRLGFFYDDIVTLDIPVEILIEKNENGQIHFFVTIDNKWRDVEMIRFQDHSPHASENISYYIGKKAEKLTVVKPKKDQYSIKIPFAQTSITLLIDKVLMERFSTCNFRDQILSNAIVWACLKSKDRIIQVIEVTDIADDETVGIEYHFSNCQQTDFDQLTVQT